MLKGELAPDLFWLAVTAMAVALMWLPHMARLFLQTGFWTAIWNPQHEIQPEAHWAQRAKRAQRNAARHFAVFAVLLLIGHVAGASPVELAWYAQLWLITRAGHFLTYMFGIPAVPQLLFLANIGTSLVLGARLLLAASGG